MDIDSVHRQALASVRSAWNGRPQFGVILGTGAAEIGKSIQSATCIPYDSIPGFPSATVIGHAGQFVCGRLGTHEVVAMQGRFHLYEGYSVEQVKLPLQIMHSMGVRLLFITNAAGGINPRFRSGDIMGIDSHIDLMFRRWPAGPLAGSVERPAGRADVYDRTRLERAVSHARQQGFDLHRGVYAAMTGPTYETRAEYRFLKKIGADVVGMSTVPEVILAGQLGMRVLAFSIIANVANPDQLAPTSGKEVVEAAAQAAPRLGSLVTHAMNAE